MMNRTTVVVTFAIFLCATTANADDGKIRICRHQGLIEAMDHKSVPVPSGSSFTTSGPTSDFVVTTTADVKLGPKPGCMIAPAKITENQAHKEVTHRSGLLVPQFSTPGASLEARVVADFK